MEKNLTSNNGSVDEELLRKFFADSARMQVADNGFSRRVMQHLQTEVSERQRMIYNVWTAVWAVACVVAFFANGGWNWVKSVFVNGYVHVAAALPKGMPHVDIGSLLHNVDISGTTPLMVALTIVVLGSVAVWDAAQN